MKKSIIVLLMLILLSATACMAQEGTATADKKIPELEVLELQITVLTERRDKLHAQAVIVETERQKLVSQYMTKKAEIDKAEKDKIKEGEK